ncbi:hypothetical protein SCATT_09370 [Streptantibioticus cattleyicolor NRRL 8057 = DSM 46488]|uniref:Uncharacterized protein n=1 Tax=Streptantibioticus cattleyicolor (strain ATCC 35852 / DSM 46488 / JCM 4925 / NBRC 14057 / NRRL 8057) TaxID=1003195 RepID=G8WN25_STREN|nr:hypothetical protein SCATT_09370 [Streptantibioticus cattleyicolor NRRL 8057 = DSM 46488]
MWPRVTNSCERMSTVEQSNADTSTMMRRGDHLLDRVDNRRRRRHSLGAGPGRALAALRGAAV